MYYTYLINNKYNSVSEPMIPAQSSLLRVNATFISLNLASWLDGGCPITSMVVEYQVSSSIFALF